MKCLVRRELWEHKGAMAIAPIALAAAMLALAITAALHDERADRSILFWKSLPVSDLSTVLSKASTALVAAPAIALCAAVCAAFAVSLVWSLIFAVQGIELAGALLANPALYLTPLKLLSLLPGYIDLVGLRVFGALVPGTWLADGIATRNPLTRPLPQNIGDAVASSYALFAQPGIWIGAMAGLAMIAVAARLRRWRE